MGFWSNLLDKIRGINQENKIQSNIKSYMFGVILGGTYANWKTDPNPTFFCFGVYIKNNQRYVHGIQLHAIGGNVDYIIKLIQNMKSSGVITNPYSFYNYIKLNNPYIIKQGYRTYKVEASNFKVVNAGLTNIKGNFSSQDPRDYFLNQLNPNPPKWKMNITDLKNNITRVINTVKIW